MDMYIWEVKIEVEYITRWRDSSGNEESETWTEFEAYDNTDDREENEPIKTTAFNRVTDLVYLSLKEVLDG